MTDNKPLVSIIMPVYNSEKYLADAIESVFSSDYDNIELLLLDDKSSDSSVDISRRYEKDNPRIRVFELEHHGVSTARNHGISESTGQYVLFVDSDDLIHPHLISKLVEGAVSNNADIVMEPYKKFFGKVPYIENDEEVDYSVFDSNETIMKSFISRVEQLGRIGGVMVRKSLAEDGFDTRFYRGEDTLFVYKHFDSASAVVILEKPWYYYRMHSANAINNVNFESLENSVECYQVIADSERTKGNDVQACFWERRIAEVLHDKYIYAGVHKDIELRNKIETAIAGKWHHYLKRISFKRRVRWWFMMHFFKVFYFIRSIKRKVMKNKYD